jgi:protein-S-isoprenylcysteine O-methyltransferase Ste14
MSPLKVYGDFIFKFRNLIFPIAFVVLFLFSEPREYELEGVTGQIIFWAAIATAILGQAFRLFVIGLAYIKRGGKEGKVYADHLVIRGLYAHTRNPMYVGNILVVVGLAVAYGSLLSFYFILPFFLVSYLAITTAEETYLRNKFGKEYEAYEKSVNRFWPNLKGLRQTLSEFEYDWKRAVRKDYGNVFEVFFVIILIVTWKANPFAELSDRLLASVWNPWFAALVAFYLYARFLKKTGKLASSN